MVTSVSEAVDILTSTSPFVIFQRLVRGEYTNRRKTLESKNALFGFNKQAICVTSTMDSRLKIVTLDILQRKVVDQVLPSMLEHSEMLDKVSVLHGDDYDQELIIILKTLSRNVYIWKMSHGTTKHDVRMIDPSFVSRSGMFQEVSCLRKLSADGKRQYVLVSALIRHL